MMLQTLRHFLSLVRFSHTLFALPFALLAALMAWRLPALDRDGMNTYPQHVGPLPEFGWTQVLGILFCMATARTMAMAFNRLVDSKLDAGNPRTASRHLPAGILSVPQVAALTAACGLAFIASTLLFLPNRLPLYLSIPVLTFLCGYSYAKRFTNYAHFWLGTALALSPVAAWIAIRGEAVLRYPADLLPALVLGGAVLTWVAGFDIIYGCQDFEFDRQSGLHSVPARWGIARALRIAAACHAATIALLSLLPSVYPPFGTIYWVAVAAVAVLLIYEHALVRPHDLERVNVAFFHVNAAISLGLLAAGALDLWLGHG